MNSLEKNRSQSKKSTRISNQVTVITLINGTFCLIGTDTNNSTKQARLKINFNARATKQPETNMKLVCRCSMGFVDGHGSY